MTAINIPDMVKIVREHGLSPVPFDLDPMTMIPIGLEALKKIITPKTKAVIFAYIYGIKYDINPYVDYLREQGIDIIEDIAQSFSGSQKYNGNINATMSFFSFGIIKIATCMQGGVTVIRNQKLYTTMRNILDTYQKQSIVAFYKKAM